MKRWLLIIIAVLILLSGIQAHRVGVYKFALANVATEKVKAERDAEQKARAAEQASAIAMAKAGEQYEKGKRDAEEAGKAVVADLRAGTLQLHKRWQGCLAARVSEIGSGAGEPDAGAEDRADSAGRIVRAAAECDAQVKGLQAVILADRGE